MEVDERFSKLYHLLLRAGIYLHVATVNNYLAKSPIDVFSRGLLLLNFFVERGNALNGMDRTQTVASSKLRQNYQVPFFTTITIAYLRLLGEMFSG